MVSLSGVFCALKDMGVLDCAMYTSGLSGSAWYVTLICLFKRKIQQYSLFFFQKRVASQKKGINHWCLTYFRYLSTLYSHPEWPTVHPHQIRQELKENVKDNWMWLLLTPSWLYTHMSIILRKKSRGQPVSFTDFFGYLVGETILKDVSLPEPRSLSTNEISSPS